MDSAFSCLCPRVPLDSEAVQRLHDMGYTIHRVRSKEEKRPSSRKPYATLLFYSGNFFCFSHRSAMCSSVRLIKDIF